MTQAEALAAAYHRVFDPGFAEGQLVLADLLDAAGVADAAEPGDADSGIGLAWRDGRRSIGVFILKRLSLSAAEIALLQRRRGLSLVHGETMA